ncbi:MAG: hypothetical protein ACI4TZ_00795 [Christensenellales bacterium]
MSIKKAKLSFLTNQDKYTFFKNLPQETKQFFYDCGYIPTDFIDANNFVNSLAKLNEKEEYDIDYALKDVLPKEKFYKLNTSSYIYALYPKVWDKLAVEDRLICLNFAYKDLLSKKNLDNSYRLIWFNKNYDKNIFGSCDFFGKRVYVNFDKILSISGFYLFATLAHEINHIKQKQQQQNINRLKDISSLNTYEKMENDDTDYFYTFLSDPKFLRNFIDDDYRKKLANYENTLQWERLNDIFYCCDLLEISSRNVEIKTLKKYANQFYNYYNDDAKNNKDISIFCNNIQTMHDEKNFSKKYIENLNKFQTLFNNNLTRFYHLNQIMLKIDPNIPYDVHLDVIEELSNVINTQNKLSETLIDMCENKYNFPKYFDYSLFDKINELIVKNKETTQDTINYYKKLEQERKQELEQQIKQEIKQQFDRERKTKEKNQLSDSQNINEL